MRGVRKNFAVNNRIVGESARTQHLDEGDTVSTPKSAPPFSSSRVVVAAGPGARYRPGNSSMRQQLEVGVLGDNASTVTDATQLSPLRRPRRRTKRRSQAEAAARATAKKAVKEILLCTLCTVRLPQWPQYCTRCSLCPTLGGALADVIFLVFFAARCGGSHLPVRIT